MANLQNFLDNAIQDLIKEGHGLLVIEQFASDFKAEAEEDKKFKKATAILQFCKTHHEFVCSLEDKDVLTALYELMNEVLHYVIRSIAGDYSFEHYC